IRAAPAPWAAAPEGPTGGITGLVYSTIRGITHLVGVGIDAALAPFAPLLGDRPSTAERDVVLGVLNGVVGDHLQATHNPLAVPLALRIDGEPQRRLVVLVHGLCMSDRGWQRRGHDHGKHLAAAIGATAVYA